MKIVTTPRVVAGMLAVSFAAYFWLMNTFYTNAQAQAQETLYNEHVSGMESRLDEHIIASSIYRVEADLHDTEDKLWLLNEQMLVSTGNTPERRQKAHEYQQRIDALNSLKACLRSQHEGCELRAD